MEESSVIQGARADTYEPVSIPAHLPQRLTITLWDFSWYVRTGPGEPFEDLDRAVAEAVERGYNTIRICAMPFLLFASGLDTSEFEMDRLGGEYAQGVRWYDVKSATRVDGRAHLLALFEACESAGVFVILSSWEYQQSSAFAVDRAWWDALRSVDPELRAERLVWAVLSSFMELSPAAACLRPHWMAQCCSGSACNASFTMLPNAASPSPRRPTWRPTSRQRSASPLGNRCCSGAYSWPGWRIASPVSGPSRRVPPGDPQARARRW